MVIVPALPTPPKPKIPGAYVAAESSSSAAPSFLDDLDNADDDARPLARQKIFYDALFGGRQVLLRAADSRHVRKLRAERARLARERRAVEAWAETEREWERRRRQAEEEENAEFARLLGEDLRKAQAAHRRAYEEEEFARLLEVDLRKAREAHRRAHEEEEFARLLEVDLRRAREAHWRAVAEEAARREEEEEERRRAEAEEAARREEESLRRAEELRRVTERQEREHLEEERRRWEQEELLRLQAQAAVAASARPQQEAAALHVYEAKWVALLRPEGEVVPPRTLGFGDVPWPLFGAVESVQDITWQRVREFVFHPQRGFVQGTYQAKSIRLEMLRWHPDKFEWKVLDKIIEGDREAVKEAAGHVARILTQLTMEVNDR